MLHKYFFWGALLVSLAGFLHLVSDVLKPFFIAFIFAYILQPIISYSSAKFGISKNILVFMVFTLFIGTLIVTIIIVAPVIIKQAAILIKNIPEYRAYLLNNINDFSNRINQYDTELVTKVSQAIQNGIKSVFYILSGVANNIWEYTVATINMFMLIALVPIILYYFLRDWNKILFSIEGVIPLQGKSKISQIIIDINSMISAYIRGQMNICIILTIYYTVGLSAIGLDLALLIGLLSGFLIIIPFIGFVFSIILAALNCYLSFTFGYQFLYVIILYCVGHIIEGYILAPKIIANKIGLHPVWILFSVFAAGSILGFWGIFFAIPIAGIIKILLLHFIKYYKNSNYFSENELSKNG